MPEIEELGDEQLDTLLDDIGSTPNDDEAIRSVVQKATEETDPPRVEETPPPEPAKEPETAPAAETTPEPPKEETPETPPAEPTIEQLDKQLFDKRLEAAEGSAKHWETIAGRHGGELGFVKKRLAEMERAMASGQFAPPPAPADNGEGVYDTPEPTPTPQATPPDAGGPSDKVAAWAVAQALQAGYQQFLQAHPDAQTTEGFAGEMEAYMQQQGGRERLLFENDPVAAQRGAMDFLSEAYHHVSGTRRASEIQKLERRRADQISNMEQAKAQATISTSGSPAPEPPGPKALSDMNEDELDAILQELGEEESDRRASGKQRNR